MPIDPDAYMAGAIPTLSRGGSWLPTHPHHGSLNPASPTSSTSPTSPTNPAAYGGTLTPASQPGINAAMMMANNPFWVPRTPFSLNPATVSNMSIGRLPYFSASATGAGGFPNPWLARGSSAGSHHDQSPIPSPSQRQNRQSPGDSPPHSLRIRQSPQTTQTVRKSPRSPLAPETARGPDYPASPRSAVSPASVAAGSTRTHRPPLRHQGWASDPRPRRAGRWREQELEDGAGAPRLIAPEPDYTGRQDRPPIRPVRPTAEALPEAPTSRVENSPMVGRTGTSQGDTRDTHRPDLRRRRRHTDGSGLTLQARRYKADGVGRHVKLGTEVHQDEETTSTCSTCDCCPGEIQSPLRSRPGLPKRHTDKSTRTNLVAPKSGAINSQTQHSRQRHLSTPVRGGRSAPPSPIVGSSERNLDLTPLSAVLPSESAGGRTKFDKPVGYVSPLSHEGYDRYAAHPAAPAVLSAGNRTISIGIVTQTSPSGPDDRQVESEEYRDRGYLPLGYARPTREIGWNRDGPAMKTYGVAWGRKAGPVLPDGPRGPSWVQARPPRAELVLGGEWWASGGTGV
ncbi:hypothetical protein EHS25_009638 [Saitozyma podzolica]|uniref:Uncharacterized protein n=1 Tax=Saitozyma podzolica TaxID=1890683 RepID=A0A427YJU2_9TREE|nr:hypothetical protein EHS25_009638 [Saitozyma podzolica]